MLTLAQALEKALEFHQQGKLAEAEQLYQAVLNVDGNDFNVLHLFGVLRIQQGRQDEAISLIGAALGKMPGHAGAHNNLAAALNDLKRHAEAAESCRNALSINPDFAEAHNNLGLALNGLGRREQAIASYRSALALKPQFVEAHNNLGNVLNELKRHEEAIASYRSALAARPGYAEAHYNLGGALATLDRHEEAIASYRQALALNPSYAEAHNNLGGALDELKRHEEAVASYQKALALRPDYAHAHYNLGGALAALDRHEEAIASYRKALAIKPDYAEAHNNLGAALNDQARHEEAAASCRTFLAVSPEHAETHNHLGIALDALRRHAEAMASYRKAIALKPDFGEAHANLANALQETGCLDEAIEAHRRAVELAPGNARFHDNLVLAMHYHAQIDAAAILQECLRWDARHARPLYEAVPAHGNDRSPERRLRIGFVSPDLRMHSVAFFLTPLLEAHDRRMFQFVCYATHTRTDEVSERLRAASDGWHQLAGVGDDEAARRIREDRIDILIDLSGHMAHNRLLLFARKPAPVQITYLGFPGTTGMHAIDYRLSDVVADPPGSERFCSEALLRLPGCAWCFVPLSSAPPVSTLPALQDGGVTFGSFNKLAKVTSPTLELWARILQRVSGSRLLLKSAALRGTPTSERIRGFFAERGVVPSRVELLPDEPSMLRHLQCYGRMDIALDTFPYHGTTTTCEALWMGVPVITLVGERHASRVGASLLANVGHEEWVTQNAEDYVQRAVDLSADLPRLAGLRAGLRERMQGSALMDAARLARAFEAACRDAWRRWCAAPESGGVRA